MITVYTIGHASHDKEKFIEMLKAHGIKLLIDVRTIPKSRKVPQFNWDVLEEHLRKHKILYVYMPQLGILRHFSKDSLNTGWRNLSFRGFADYMQTEEFWNGIEDLMIHAAGKKTAIMCAEALPWRCHRSLIADALLSKGAKVFHIISPTNLLEHKMTKFAKVMNGRITYPAQSYKSVKA
ncbi:MAG: DUF488 domain-containing protein [Nanoarchaeota archaeon]|nr:DUF488 domain-containing protein [Nanoarchaeota archaeon]